MSMRRFFVRPADVAGDHLRLTGDEAAHLGRVLRLGPGTPIVAFDGVGHEYVAVVERLDAACVRCQIVQRRDVEPTKAVPISLGQGLPKADTFAWVIQKATELGVTAIVPLLTERVVPHVAASRLAAKQMRWQTIARQACKQCGRASVPHIEAPTALEAFFVSHQDAGLKLILWEGEPRRGLRIALEAAQNVASVALVIGPEGGLTPAEVACGATYGFSAVGLGERILRTETATLVALTLMQYRFGDLG